MPWLERIRNKEILKKISTPIFRIMQKIHFKFFVHIMKKVDLKNLPLVGNIEGKRDTGKELVQMCVGIGIRRFGKLTNTIKGDAR